MTSVARIDRTAAPFNPTVIQQQFVAPHRIVKLAQCFAPTVETADQVVGVGVINRPAVPWPPIIGAVSGGGGSVGTGGVSQPPVATPIAVVIRYNGVDITADVELRSATFTALVNGATGSASLRVRDDDHSHSFTSGGTLTVDIGSQRVWGGFVTRAQKVYPFSVQDPDVTPERYWQLQGVDYNILFTKRIVFDAAHPASKLSFDYPVGTYDDTIIADLFDNYLTLGDDGLSRAGVERVDIVTLDIKGVTSGKGTLTNGRGQIASAGYTWKQAMDVISRATGAVYYIDPDKVLNYVDVDTPDAPYGLSDAPGGELGYQNFRLTYNGTQLINDMLVWGTALGSDQVVFSRAQDSTSQSGHGIWQESLVTSGLYKQASANLVSSSYLNGTPQNKRGHKDDAISFSCRVFEPFFRVGQKVSLTNTVFGYSDVLPIRRMDIRFINQSQATFDLTLSHEIDQPWMIFEQIIPPIGDFSFDLPPIYIPDPFPPPPPVEGGCDCGVTDSFDREKLDSLGTSDSGIVWQYGNTTGHVTGGKGYINVSSNGYWTLSTGSFTDFQITAQEVNIVSQSTGDSGLGHDTKAAVFIFIDTNDTFLEADFDANGYLDFYTNESFDTPSDPDYGIQTVVMPFTNEDEYKIRIVITGPSTADCYCWLASDPMPNSPTLSITHPDYTFHSIYDFGIGGSGGTFDVALDDLIIDGVNRCTEFRFDNFNRTVSSAWGVSTFGSVWVIGNPADTGMFSVNGTQGVIAHSSGSPQMTVSGASDPYKSPEFTMTSLFTVGSMSSVQSDFVVYRQNGRNRVLDMEIATHSSGTNPGYLELDFDSASRFPFAFVVGSSYYVKWHYVEATGLSEAKVWLAGTAEPSSWQATTNYGPGDGSATSFDVHLQGKNPSSGFTYTHLIEYIDFDYDGKPCYECPRFDDFNRVVAAEGAGISDAGFSWGTSGTNSDDHISVDGSALSFDWVGSCGLMAAMVEHGPWVANNTWEMRSRFRTPNVSGSGVHTMEYRLGGGYGTLRFEIGTTQTVGDPVNIGQTAFSWEGNTWYLVRWNYTYDGLEQIKVWKESDPEPSTWTTEILNNSSGANPGGAIEFAIRMTSLGGTSSALVDWIDFDYDGKPCSPDSSPDSSPGSTTGWTCEQYPTGVLERVDSTHYRTTSYITAGSSEVYVDGYLQRPGIAREYTESTNAEGIIEFTDPVDAGAVVKVCYSAAGARVE